MMEMVPLHLIHEGPTNPREHFDLAKLQSLADNIKVNGVTQPILLRPQGDEYELVYGRRRRRAAELAGLVEIPANIRDLTDEQARIEALIENGQREDVHPLEEAKGYQDLQLLHGLSPADIAGKVGKGVAHVYTRLRLNALCEEARTAFWDGKLTGATALLIARLPAALQAQATDEITDHYGDVMRASDAAAHITRKYMLRLCDATFDRGDASLCEGAGPCTTCPKRTGAQPELFADVDSPDLCIDPICYQAKQDAQWDRAQAAAKSKGQKILPQKDAKAIFYGGGQLSYGAPYEDLKDKCGDDPKKRTYAQILKSLKGNAPPTILARDPAGGIHELKETPAAPEKKKRGRPKKAAS